MQTDPFAQGKLVRVEEGKNDVAIDLRKDSKTYLKWVGEIVSGEFKKVWIPEGFGHAFLTLSQCKSML